MPYLQAYLDIWITVINDYSVGNHVNAARTMNAKSVSFGDVLSDKNRYIVPNNQRRYAWEKEQIGQFFKDVMYAYDQIKHETQFQYFFGPMVFIRDGDKQIVADGQQRLATANVFIAVIRDLLLDLNDGAESTNNHGLKYQHKKIISNITLGRHNKEFYNDYIIKQGSAKDKKDLLTKRKYQQKTDPNFWLAFAYCEFYDNLKKIMRSKIKEYVKLQSIVLDVFTIIKIDVNTTEYAYRIFETLNERGMPLAISDMIKNHVIECSKPKDRDLINTRWEEMIGVVGTKKINLYVRHFWIANYENVAKRELYKKISERMRKSKTGKKITNYVRDLHTQAEIFVALHDPIQYNSMWGRDSQIIDDLKMLNQLNSEVVKIVLLIAKAQKEKKPQSIQTVSTYDASFLF